MKEKVEELIKDIEENIILLDEARTEVEGMKDVIQLIDVAREPFEYCLEKLKEML